jgi:hypothetical protein
LDDSLLKVFVVAAYLSSKTLTLFSKTSRTLALSFKTLNQPIPKFYPVPLKAASPKFLSVGQEIELPFRHTRDTNSLPVGIIANKTILVMFFDESFFCFHD